MADLTERARDRARDRGASHVEDAPFPAYDFDCDDVDPEPAPARPSNTHRRIRVRRVAGDSVAEKEEMLVQCPFRDEWPAFDDCLGYSIDPRDRDSLVSCARAT